MTVDLPLEAWDQVLRAMKSFTILHSQGKTNAEGTYPFSNQLFMHALAKIQLAVDQETL